MEEDKREEFERILDTKPRRKQDEKNVRIVSDYLYDNQDNLSDNVKYHLADNILHIVKMVDASRNQGILEERERVKKIIEDTLKLIKIRAGEICSVCGAETSLGGSSSEGIIFACYKKDNTTDHYVKSRKVLTSEMISSHQAEISQLKYLLSQLDNEQPEPKSFKEEHKELFDQLHNVSPTLENKYVPEKELKIGDKIDTRKRESCICKKDCYCNCIYCKCLSKRTNKSKGGITMSLDQCCMDKNAKTK